MEVRFYVNLKTIFIILLIAGCIFFSMRAYTQIVANKRSIQGIVNYLNKQAQPQPEQVKEAPKEEVKKEEN